MPSGRVRMIASGAHCRRSRSCSDSIIQSSARMAPLVWIFYLLSLKVDTYSTAGTQYILSSAIAHISTIPSGSLPPAGGAIYAQNQIIASLIDLLWRSGGQSVKTVLETVPGRLGVDLFFCLSGCHNLSSETSRRSPISQLGMHGSAKACGPKGWNSF